MCLPSYYQSTNGLIVNHALVTCMYIKFKATKLRNVYILEENLKHFFLLQIFRCLYELFTVYKDQIFYKKIYSQQ